MIERIALIDVCDVVVDLRPPTIKLAGLKLRPQDCTQWDIFNLINEEECIRVMKLFDDPEFWRHLPPVKGVHEGIEGLMRQDYKIHFLTSPWYTCENWEGVRRTWLAEQFKWFHPLDMTATAYKFRFDGDLLIDDRPKHVKMWQATHPTKEAWAFDMDFNKTFKWPRRCTWDPTGIRIVPG